VNRVRLTTLSDKEAIMSGLRGLRSASPAKWLAISLLTCASTFLLSAEEPMPAHFVVPQEPPAPQTSYMYTLSPEEQGDLQMARGNYVAAIQAYQHGQLRSADTWNKMGIAYHHLFALDEARKDYEAAIALNPHYADALNNLAAVYHGKHDYKRAERTYKRALKYNPHAAITYCNLGTSYFARSKYKQGVKAYQKAFSLDPNVFNPKQTAMIEEGASREQRVAVNYYLAKTYATAGKNQEALECLRKALAAGFNDRKHLMQDPEFAMLRTTPEFHTLMVQQHLN
jgi:tetratricopeptide (TPR) repeat protein